MLTESHERNSADHDSMTATHVSAKAVSTGGTESEGKYYGATTSEKLFKTDYCVHGTRVQ